MRSTAMRRCQHVDRPQHVDLGVGSRVLDGVTYVDLRGHVEHELWPQLLEHRSQRGGVAHIDFVQHCARCGRPGEVLTLARDQRVDDRHLISTRDQRVDQIRPDEAGAAGYETAHVSCVGTRRSPASAFRFARSIHTS